MMVYSWAVTAEITRNDDSDFCEEYEATVLTKERSFRGAELKAVELIRADKTTRPDDVVNIESITLNGKGTV